MSSTLEFEAGALRFKNSLRRAFKNARGVDTMATLQAQLAKWVDALSREGSAERHAGSYPNMLLVHAAECCLCLG